MEKCAPLHGNLDQKQLNQTLKNQKIIGKIPMLRNDELYIIDKIY